MVIVINDLFHIISNPLFVSVDSCIYCRQVFDSTSCCRCKRYNSHLKCSNILRIFIRHGVKEWTSAVAFTGVRRIVSIGTYLTVTQWFCLKNIYSLLKLSNLFKERIDSREIIGANNLGELIIFVNLLVLEIY